MKKLLCFCCALLILGSCRKDQHAVSDATVNPASKQDPAAVKADDWVWINNDPQVQVYDPATSGANFSSPIFQWKPQASNGYSQYAIDRWNGPVDFKLRNSSRWGGTCFVACSVWGLTTIASYPSGQKKWAYNVGDPINPHGVELLPNGNIAVAGTDGNWVRVYGSSASTATTDVITYGSFTLYGAHAVLWDPDISRLWAIGNDWLVALQVGGTAANPVLTEDTARHVYLNTTVPTRYGHDITPDPADHNILWFTTNHGVYKLNKSTHAVTLAPGNLGNRWFVKGLGKQVSGLFTVTQADSFKSPFPTGGIDDNTSTKWMDVYASNGTTLQYSKKTPGAAIYKGKLFRQSYY